MEVTSSCTYQTYPHTGPNDSGYYVNIPTSHTTHLSHHGPTKSVRHFWLDEYEKFEIFSV